MPDRSPQVSVVIVTYNCDRYLPIAVESILRQTFSDLELIVIDNASTDGTRQFLDSVTDPRLVRINNPRNGGPQAANLALPVARGRYLARLDADDVALPDRLRRQFEFMEAHPDIGLCGSAYEEIDENGKHRNQSAVVQDAAEIRWQLGWQNFIGHSTVMARTQLVTSLGGYREDLWCVQDYDLISRVALTSKVTMLPDCLVQYRVYSNSITHVRNEEMLRTSLQVSVAHLEKSLEATLDSNITNAAIRIMRQLECPPETDWQAALGLIARYTSRHTIAMPAELGVTVRRKTAEQLLRYARAFCRGRTGMRARFEVAILRMFPCLLATRIRAALG